MPGSHKGQKNQGGPGSRGGKVHTGSHRTLTEIGSLARSYTERSIKILASIMENQNEQPMARIAAAKIILDRGWGKASETHKIDMNGETNLLKVVNEIVHVHETREQIEFRDQTPLLELVPDNNDDPNGSKKTH